MARAHRIHLADEVIDRTLAFIDELPAEGTASLQRDIADGRPSELEAWNGSLVRLGREMGVPTPVNEFIDATLLGQEKRNRGELG